MTLREGTSVVVPCFNAEATLRDTLASLIGQTKPPREILVVDDGSADATPRIASEFGGSVRVLRQANRGACAARNRGLAECDGSAVMFLDGDDLLAPETLEALGEALANDPAAGLAACPFSYLLENGDGWKRVTSAVGLHGSTGDDLADWLSGWFVPTCSVLWRRRSLEAVGPWDEALAQNQDGDLMLRALMSGLRIARTARGEGRYRRRAGRQATVSSIRSEEALRSRLRVLDKAAEALTARGLLHSYRIPLGRAYHELARTGYRVSGELARAAHRRASEVAGRKAIGGPFLHRAACHVLGFERRVRLSLFLRRIGVGTRAEADVP